MQKGAGGAEEFVELAVLEFVDDDAELAAEEASEDSEELATLAGSEEPALLALLEGTLLASLEEPVTGAWQEPFVHVNPTQQTVVPALPVFGSQQSVPH